MNPITLMQVGVIGWAPDYKVTANPGPVDFTVNSRTIGQIQQDIEAAEASLVRLKAELEQAQK